MNQTRITLIIILIALAVGLLFWPLLTPKEDFGQRVQKIIAEQEKHADILFKNVVFEEIVSGIRYWQLSAESAMVNKSTGAAALQKVNGIFYKSGRPVLKFISPAALWDMKQKEIYLDKPLGYNVNLENKVRRLLNNFRRDNLSRFNLPPAAAERSAGYWFQANNLSWKLADQQLVCTGGIILTKGEITGRAEKLTGDVGLERVIIEGRPVITIAFANGQIARLESQSARYLEKDGKLELKGNIAVNYNDITASGGSADYLIGPQQIILAGQASARQGENRLSGNKIMVSLKDQKISLFGKGKVTVSGEEIKP